MVYNYCAPIKIFVMCSSIDIFNTFFKYFCQRTNLSIYLFRSASLSDIENIFSGFICAEFRGYTCSRKQKSCVTQLVYVLIAGGYVDVSAPVVFIENFHITGCVSRSVCRGLRVFMRIVRNNDILNTFHNLFETRSHAGK